jgi:hypothetical protein
VTLRSICHDARHKQTPLPTVLVHSSVCMPHVSLTLHLHTCQPQVGKWATTIDTATSIYQRMGLALGNGESSPPTTLIK